MGSAMFYHLTQSTFDQALRQLVGRSLANGWRVAVRGRDPAQIDWLDQRLWLGASDSFLAHGVEGGPHDAMQPVLLGCGGEVANGAVCLMSVGGAEVSVDEVQTLERVCILFDGSDGGAVQFARGQWKALTGAGCAAQYWSEESGRWEMKAESK